MKAACTVNLLNGREIEIMDHCSGGSEVENGSFEEAGDEEIWNWARHS